MHTAATQEKVCDGNVTEFADCTVIKGNLYIEDVTSTHLDGLSTLKEVTGDVILAKNKYLLNLDGLSNLRNIGGSLVISKNSMLLHVHGLRSLEAIKGSLVVTENASLSDLSALSALQTIGSDVYITDSKVEDICAFTSLRYLGGQVNAVDSSGRSFSDYLPLKRCSTTEAKLNLSENNPYRSTRWSAVIPFLAVCLLTVAGLVLIVREVVNQSNKFVLLPSGSEDLLA